MKDPEFKPVEDDGVKNFSITIDLSVEVTDEDGLRAKHAFLWDGGGNSEPLMRVPDLRHAIGMELLDRIMRMTQFKNAIDSGEQFEMFEFFRVSGQVRPTPE